VRKSVEPEHCIGHKRMSITRGMRSNGREL
jgi:hypothetical protein